MNIVVDTFAGDGASTAFSLSAVPGSKNDMIVVIDGVVQLIDAYEIVGGDLVLDAAPVVGAVIEARLPIAGAPSPTPVVGFSGDGTTTAFALGGSPASKNSIVVLIDGILQGLGVYDVNGATLDFVEAPASGAAIEIRLAVLGIDTAIDSRSFLADGSGSSLDLIAAPASRNNVVVAIDGLIQEVGAYQIASNILTFGAVPATGALIEVRYLLDALPVIGVVADGSVTTPKLAADAVVAAKIADAAVGTSELADGAVAAAKLAAGAVGSAALADGAVVGGKIAAGAVGSAELAVTGVTPGSYTNTALTVGADGRLTAASSGASSGFDIHGLPAVTSAVADDELALYQVSGAGNRKITIGDLDYVINVRQHGVGPGNSAAANSANIGGAIALLGATKRVLYFPAGVYQFDAPFTITDRYVTVIGDGAESTELQFTGGSGGVALIYNSQDLPRRFQGHVWRLSLVTAQADGGTALTIQCPSGNNTTFNFSVKNVVIRSTTQYMGDATYWSNGIDIERGSFIVLDDVTLYGHGNNPLGTSGNSQAAIRWAGTDSDGRYHLTFTHLKVTNWKYAFQGVSGIEGIYGSHFEFWECEYGFHIDRTSVTYGGGGRNSGVFHVTSGHINAGRDPIFVNAMRAIQLSNVDIYNGCRSAHYGGNDGSTALSGVCVELIDCLDVAITNCKIEAVLSPPSLNNVKLLNCEDFVIHGNIIRSVKDTGIWIAGTTKNGRITGNYVLGRQNASPTGVYIESAVSQVFSSANLIRNCATLNLNTSSTAGAGRPRGAVLYRSGGALTLTNSSSIQFDTTSYDTDGFGNTSNGRITIPAALNGSHVRLGANVAAGGNTETEKAFRIRKNGSDGGSPGMPVGTKISTAGTAANFASMVTGWLPVVTGDYFEVIPEFTSTTTCLNNSSFWLEVME